jgi:hypothetical protein
MSIVENRDLTQSISPLARRESIDGEHPLQRRARDAESARRKRIGECLDQIQTLTQELAALTGARE